jgi:positive regulator of sigma E activity
MIRRILSRLGCLIFSAGGILLVLGISAESSGEPAFRFILLGFLLGIGGFFLWRKFHRKPRQNTRFSLFKKRGSKPQAEEEPEDRGWNDGYYD